MANKPMTYAASGVDIDAGDHMVHMIRHHLQRTYGPRVLGKYGGFAGCFRLDYNEKLFKRNYRDPVLVACTDGVGSKVKLAVEMDVHDTVGIDLVAMSVNDMIVQGAEPLFFLDYIGTHKLGPEKMTQLVKGVADGCAMSGCALLGGETAEMPDLYAKDEYDLAGFAVGVCELNRMIDGSKIERGDVILGLASSGIHSNGYSLVRAIVKESQLDPRNVYAELDDERTLGEVLLTPTRIYVKSILSVLGKYKVKHIVTGMAHITGGGIVGNLCRPLSEKLDAKVMRSAWEIPPVFRFLQKHGRVEDAEMDRVFNMGIGYCVIVKPDFADSVTAQLEKTGEKVYRLGQIVKGKGEVAMV
ncbi:MAG: phosphoribosylformylglycinamidine cyclo-ligase [Phycisphaerales bacterium]